ncbi:MAG TPA: hypothetical protein VL916_01195 [Ilumatobacteraceae bacterium]|nr:hypothetical protein [Ilumatobacteraceae bacterium]
MEPLTAHARPITRLVARADSVRAATSRCGVTYAPPRPCPGEAHGSDNRIGTTEDVLRALLLGIEAAPLVSDILAPSIVVWSPEVFGAGWSNAMSALGHGIAERDSLSELAVHVISAQATPSRVFVEWRLSGRFTEPCFVDDDLLVEPTGRHVEVGGVVVATFDDHLLTAVHCYYDGLAILEQLIADQ